MDIESLFADVPLAKFIDEYLHRLPFTIAGTAQAACEFGTWNSLVGILKGASQEDASAVRDGQWYRDEMPTTLEAARALGAEGYTIFVRHAERYHARLAELAGSFEKTFGGPVNIHMFATPAGSPGFSWHYDAEDVFIVQTAGEKEYSLRKNTVHPWPLEETLPDDMRYEREIMPLMRATLRAGDLLYIPCGYWHKAEAKGGGPGARQEKGSVPNFSEQKIGTDPAETSISLAIGVMSRSAMDVYDFLRSRLVQSLVWRQRLPVPHPKETSRVQWEATCRHLFAQLAGDLAKLLNDPNLAAELLNEWRAAQGTDDGKTAD
jgi:hypothetical protein